MDNIVDKVTPKDLSRKELFNIFEEILESSDIRIILKEKCENGIVKYVLSLRNENYEIFVKLKNVCNAGWKDKKYIKRIQTTPLKDIPKTSKNSCFLLGGIAFYEDNPIFVCWKAETYVYHASNRSCYVNVSSIKKAYDNSVYFGCDSNQRVYLSNKFSLIHLIDEYIKDNYSDNIEVWR